jgi:3-hydroxybutyrate dehydrogenase
MYIKDFAGKTAFVTGGASGIGLGIAKALVARGARVVIADLRADHIDSALAQFAGGAGSNAVSALQLDVTSREAYAAAAAKMQADFGGIDILVNSAGIQHTAPVEEFPPDRWAAIIAINLSSGFYTIHHAVPHMRRRGWGRIINIASVHGLVASVNKAAYVAAKHGLVGLTKVTALETAGSGITCNAICPGWTRTELIEPQIIARAEALGVDIEAGGRSMLAEKQPSQQFVSIEQLGQLALFLCSPGADQITGTAIPIDGGWTAQ